jgi:caffeic acid 3-O-methyltransferase
VPGDGSYRNAVLHFTLCPEYSATLELLSDSVLKSTEPFSSAHGMNQFEYMKTHPAFMETFKIAFKDMGSTVIPQLMLQYHGFDSVHKLVDVGGNTGVMLAAIVKKYHHIHGINFDLPEVVATNPSFPGVEQVGGDMFEKVPSGCDAIFMKGILHDWSDKQCVKILTNCYNALPSEGGKLIMMDIIMPTETPLEASLPIQRKIAFNVDILMQIHCENGRERTATELEGLLKQAGFNSLQILAEVTGSPFHVMEAHKSTKQI